MARKFLKEFKEKERDNELVPHTVLIPRKDLNTLRDFAESEGISFNAAVRVAIKRMLRESDTL